LSISDLKSQVRANCEIQVSHGAEYHACSHLRCDALCVSARLHGAPFQNTVTLQVNYTPAIEGIAQVFAGNIYGPNPKSNLGVV